MLEAAACQLPIIVVSEGVEARVQYENGLIYSDNDFGEVIAAISQTPLARNRAGNRPARGSV